MLEPRLASLKVFQEKAMPSFGPDLSALDLDDIIYYARAGIENTDDWGEIPEDVRAVYDRLGIPEAERRVLAGVGPGVVDQLGVFGPAADREAIKAADDRHIDHLFGAADMLQIFFWAEQEFFRFRKVR